MIYERSFDIGDGRAFLRLTDFRPAFDTFLKLEGLNPAGSIKLKTAREMVESAYESGRYRDGLRIIESTSGNLGVALASICAAKGIPLEIVTDPNANVPCVRHMRALGAHVVTVTERDRNGGYLQTRIDYIQRRVATDPGVVWLNQYANAANPRAHRTTTAVEIVAELGPPDWLFIGVGSAGTLMGCVEHFRAIEAPTRIVAVDAAGSVTFGGPAGTRWIPGLGSSRRPEIFADDGQIEKCVIAEPDAIRECRAMASRYGLLLGGSSGTALAGVASYSHRILPGSRVVVICPDMGDRYLDTVFDDEWVKARYGDGVLARDRSTQLAAARRDPG